MSETPLRHCRFEAFRLDVQTRELRAGDGSVVALTGKAFDTLCCLIENRHRVVGKDELLAAVWPGRVVEENNLTQAISALRRALGSEHRHIATVPGRGYRFVAEVQTGDAAVPDRDADVPIQQSSGRETRRRIDRMIILVLLLTLAYFALDKFVLVPRRTAETAAMPAPAAGAATSSTAPATVPDEHSIAVLPFVNMSADPAQEYFSEGIAEELLNQLNQSPELRVVARTSAFQFKGKNLDVAAIAHQLKVANVLEGSVRREGTRIRVTAQLIAAASGFHLWSQTFERDASDVFKVQDEIAGAIANALAAKLGGHSAARRLSNPAAYDDYLQARQYLARRAGENLRLAADLFSHAIDKDAGYAPAYSGRAFALVLGPVWKPWLQTGEAFKLASVDVDHALQLDGNSAEAFMVRGFIRLAQLEIEGSRTDFEHALALAPGSVDVGNLYGDFLRIVGALRRAESQKRRIMELDPLSFVHPQDLADILSDQGRYREAAAMARRATGPDTGRLGFEFLLAAQVRDGELDAAQETLQSLCTATGDVDAVCLVRRAQVLAAKGDVEQARTLLARAQAAPAQTWGNEPPYSLIAQVYAGDLGDFRRAAENVRASFGVAAWQTTAALEGVPGGAKLPEEVSRDPQWLAAWNDPRAAELMGLYRANIAAFRKGE